MENQKYYQTYETFLENHPELDPAWREFMEPVIQGAEDSLFAFIMSYIFM